MHALLSSFPSRRRLVTGIAGGALAATLMVLSGCTQRPGDVGTDSQTAPVNTITSEAASGENTSQTPDRQTDLLVVTTVAPITNIVSNIAGDRLTVEGLVPEGTNSHTFEPRPADGELLAEADLILVNGLSLEVPSIAMAEAVKASETPIYELGTNTINTEDWLFDNSFPEEGGKPNPHLWVNPDYAATYAELAAEQLIALDPDGKATYEANLASFLSQLDELDRVTREVVATIPAENRKLLTYHDSWPYWARKYDFEVIGALQPSDFSEPSAREVSELIDQIRDSQVPAIFGSEVFPSTIAEQIAREAGVILENTADDDLPGEGDASALDNAQLAGGDPEHTYVGMMADNLRIFATALGGDSTALDSFDVKNVVK